MTEYRLRHIRGLQETIQDFESSLDKYSLAQPSPTSIKGLARASVMGKLTHVQMVRFKPVGQCTQAFLNLLLHTPEPLDYTEIVGPLMFCPAPGETIITLETASKWDYLILPLWEYIEDSLRRMQRERGNITELDRHAEQANGTKAKIGRERLTDEEWKEKEEIVKKIRRLNKEKGTSLRILAEREMIGYSTFTYYERQLKKRHAKNS